MSTLWEDSIRNRKNKQLTIFIAPTLSKPWRRAFDEALKTFNQLSTTNKLGVTMAAPSDAKQPDPDGEGGADVQFDMGKGDITFTALGQDFAIKSFSGTAMHGKTELIRRQTGSQSDRIGKAFVFVPETPMITAQMRIGRDKFKDVQREVGPAIKHFIAAHELIHVCGLHNADHTRYGPDADLFIEQPQPFSGAFDKPDEDRFVLHIPGHSKPNVVSPPIFLKKATVDKIRDNWK
ncbi:hypothetical protein [Reyranella sp.]|uniref:hypothetical protein n=1 Tax=Reyranella sp. TaxID=1929291 RepID=UPI002F925D88